LLEERLREAATFCSRIQESSDERVATELESVRTALLGVGDSLASHFGDWGGVSRFATREPATEITAVEDAVIDRKEHMGDGVTYQQDIRGLFRDRDIQSMSFAFDLSSYDDVRANAEAIYESSPQAACHAMADGLRRMSSASAPGSTTARRSRVGQSRP